MFAKQHMCVHAAAPTLADAHIGGCFSHSCAWFARMFGARLQMMAITAPSCSSAVHVGGCTLYCGSRLHLATSSLTRVCLYKRTAVAVWQGADCEALQGLWHTAGELNQSCMQHGAGWWCAMHLHVLTSPFEALHVHVHCVLHEFKLEVACQGCDNPRHAPRQLATKAMHY